LPEERRRAKYDIYAEMIEVIAKKGTCSLTRLSYGANLPVDRAKKILQMLVSHGFVGEIAVGDGKRYRATKWGLDFLETYKRMQKFFAALKEPVIVSIPDAVLPNRVTTGYKDLDNLLFGGLPENYAVILTSPSCDERQTLIKSFLEAGPENEHVTFYVTTEASGLRRVAEKFQSNFYLFICNPHADETIGSLPNVSKLKGVGNLNEINIALASAFRRLDSKARTSNRACIEIVSDVLLQHHALDTRRWLSGLMPELKSRGFTTLAVMNPYMHRPEETQAILDLFEGEIHIYEKELNGVLQKYLKVMKMYNQRYVEHGIPLERQKWK